MAPPFEVVASIDNNNNGEEEKMVLKVKIVSKSQVKPVKPIGRKEFQLVTFDLPYIAFFYNQKLLIYKSGDNYGHHDQFDDVVAKLKDSLGVVLEDFYQLAGQLGRDEDGVFRVEYDDNMAGAELVVAAAEEIPVAELLGDDGDSSGRLKELVPYNGILNLEGLYRPLLAVQLTKLQDGVAIGCAFNHAILDGTSTWHFMRSWSEICRGALSISVQPFLDRTQVRNTKVKLELPEKSGPTLTDAIKSVGPTLREKIFNFSESAVEKIKCDVNADRSNDSKPFSTFQTLSAHLWRAVTKARQLKPEDPTVFIVFADCRKRVDPPMPDSYFGNLIQAIFTGTATGLLLAHPKDFGASMIQKAIYAHDSNAINERNTEFENNPKIFQFKDGGMNVVAVGSSPRFKVYEVDFGFGNPESVRSGTNNRFDGMVYLYPGKNGGKSIDVEISLESDVMERLLKDKEFLMEEM